MANTGGEDAGLLLARCAHGDRAAFERLYRLQSARLYAVAMRITRQPSLASDAVHDAFLQVWQNAARFDPNRGSVEGWMLGLVRYRALDITRRSSREAPEEAAHERADESPDALTQLIASTDGAALGRCLQLLEPDRRHLISLAFIEGLTHSELASRLDEPLGSVKSWIRRSLATLRKCLSS